MKLEVKMTTFPNKLVAVINKDIEPGVAKNALAHMAIGLGASIGTEALRLDDYQDKDGNKYPAISQIPFIILRAKSGEIKKTVNLAREYNIKHSAFVNTMTVGTYLEQLERTKGCSEEELVFYGCVLFGEWDKVSEMTRKFSLWK
jgi:hypothetical protein